MAGITELGLRFARRIKDFHGLDLPPGARWVAPLSRWSDVRAKGTTAGLAAKLTGFRTPGFRLAYFHAIARRTSSG